MNYTIAQERQKLSAVGQKLITREQAGFRFQHYDEDHGTLVEPAPLVFVHITETNPKNYSSDAAHARAVEAIGISRFPNTGVSYNRLIMMSGSAFEGQPMGRQGAHTVNNKGYTTCVTAGCPTKGGALTPPATNMNKTVRAYAICQNVGDSITSAELESLAKAIAADQLAGMVIRGAGLHGHRCVAFKSCPGDKMWAFMQKLEDRVNYLVAHGIKPTPTPIPEPIPNPGDDVTTPTDVVGKDDDGTAMTMGEMSSRLNWVYKLTVGDGALTTDKMRAATQAEIEEYMLRFWAAPSGTGTALLRDVRDIKTMLESLTAPEPPPADAPKS